MLITAHHCFCVASFHFRYTQQVLGIENLDETDEEKHERVASLTKSTPQLRDLSGLWFKDLYEYFQLPKQKDTVRNGFIRTGIMDAYINGPKSEDPFTL